ncbi:hypothetical protein [Nonomuraea salmonea]|uniref:hypothetical protein n=1 Tax=Nonomuraea salmonea TaxID=46181 RepID=UPI0031E7029D
MTGDRSLTRGLRARAKENARAITDENELMQGVGAAVALAEPLVAAGEPPLPALSWTASWPPTPRCGAAPTPRAFAASFSASWPATTTPRVRRYWRLVGEVTGERAPIGTTLTWLGDALARSLAR